MSDNKEQNPTEGLRIVEKFQQCFLEFLKTFRVYSDNWHDEITFEEFDNNLLDYCIQTLANNDLQQFQIEILGIFSNLFRIKSSKISLLIDRNIIKILINLINSSNNSISQVAIFQLTAILNLSSNSKLVLTYYVKSNILDPLLAKINNNDPQFFEVIYPLFIKLSTHYFFQPNDTILKVLDGIKKLLLTKNKTMVVASINAISEFICKRGKILQAVIESEIIPIILGYCSEDNLNIPREVLKSLKGFANATFEQLEYLLEKNFILLLNTILLKNSDDTILYEVLKWVQILSEKGGINVRRLILQNFVPVLINLIHHNTKFIELNASAALWHLINYAFPEDLIHIVNNDFIMFLLSMIIKEDGYPDKEWLHCLHYIINQSPDGEDMKAKILYCCDSPEVKKSLKLFL